MRANSSSFLKNDTAQVGIGTLIIFIAMVLTAAVAASVLIQTSGTLQQKAQMTGRESIKGISSNLAIDGIDGVRGGTNASSSDQDTYSTSIYRLDLWCSLKVGSQSVDLAQAIVTVSDGTGVNDLRYVDGTVNTTTAYVGTGNGTNAPSATVGITNMTYRLMVSGDSASTALEKIQRSFPDANYNGTKVLIYSNLGATGDILAVNISQFDNSTQDVVLVRADMFFVASNIRDNDQSFSTANPVMNTGDLINVYILTAPSSTVTGELLSDPDLTNNYPLVGEANLNIIQRTTVIMNAQPEAGVNTMIEFVAPSSFGTSKVTKLYP